MVGPFQSALIEGRMISDNYVIAHEMIHSFIKERKENFIGFKLDMAKAYDCMEWDFNKAVLDAFEFHHEFFQIIMECMSFFFFLFFDFAQWPPLWKFYSIKRSKVRGPFIPMFFYPWSGSFVLYAFKGQRGREDSWCQGGLGCPKYLSPFLCDDNPLFCRATFDEERNLGVSWRIIA